MATCTFARCHATIRQNDATDLHPGFTVVTTWMPEDGDLDRRDGLNYGFNDTKPDRYLAARLVRALDAGAALVFKSIGTDVNGKTYVQSEGRVFGRHMNADLKRLGY